MFSVVYLKKNKGLLTSYGDKWLGHASFAPVMNELNRRKAILYTHPTAANCCRNLQPEVPPTLVEFGTDTTCTMIDIVLSGTGLVHPPGSDLTYRTGSDNVKSLICCPLS